MQTEDAPNQQTLLVIALELLYLFTIEDTITPKTWRHGSETCIQPYIIPSIWGMSFILPSHQSSCCEYRYIWESRNCVLGDCHTQSHVIQSLIVTERLKYDMYCTWRHGSETRIQTYIRPPTWGYEFHILITTKFMFWMYNIYGGQGTVSLKIVNNEIKHCHLQSHSSLTPVQLYAKK